MYTTIIHPLRIAYNLSINEYCVLETIRALQQMEKYDFWCVTSMQQIADGLGLSRRWIIDCYCALEEKGLIRRRKSSQKDTAVRVTDEWAYYFNPINEKYLLYLKTENIEILSGDVNGLKKQLMDKMSNKDNPQLVQNCTSCAQSSHQDVKKVHINMCTKFTSRCEESSHNTNNDIYNNINNNIYSCADFDKFWNIYPNKRGKLNASKVWNKLNQKDKDLILEVLPIHCKQEQWIKNDGAFIPHASTWLNGRRWEDELIKESPTISKERQNQIAKENLAKFFSSTNY